MRAAFVRSEAADAPRSSDGVVDGVVDAGLGSPGAAKGPRLGFARRRASSEGSDSSGNGTLCSRRFVHWRKAFPVASE